MAVVLHLLQRFAAAQRKSVPALSQDAASYLKARRWVIRDLARRVWRAVAANRGSLITAADLIEP
jgi:DNA-binding NtrC family response regulator